MPICSCHAPGGYPHEPDCTWWDDPTPRPKEKEIRLLVSCDKCAAQFDDQVEPNPYNTEDYKSFGEIVCRNCRNNANEAAYERQQERLMEDGGPDTSREDQHLRDAGRGHLCR